MSFQFATCDRQTALRYLKQVYPKKTVTDSPECAGPMLDLVERDVIRVQDPYMHGSRIAVTGSKNYTEALHAYIVAAGKVFEDCMAAQPEVDAVPQTA